MHKIRLKQPDCLERQYMDKTLDLILHELQNMAALVDEKQVDAMADFLCDHLDHRIFVAAAGRSGCAGDGFAIRLLHMGFQVYRVGNVAVPPIRKGDVLFVISGSGRTTSMVMYAKKAKALGACVVTITLEKEGDVAAMADQMILLPGTTRLQKKEHYTSIQPVGSCFEQLSFLTCDAMVMRMMKRLGLNKQDLLDAHGNLE